MAPPVIQIALRTDKCFDEVKAFVDAKGFGGFAVREVAGTNEHWHWLLEAGVANIQAFRVALTRAVPDLKGNAAYSATLVKELDKYERYLAKGDSEGVNPEIAWRQSIKYDDAKMEELHEEYWTENRKLKKRKAGTAMDETLDECKRDNVAWTEREKISERFLRALVKRNRPVNIFAARSSVNAIQIQLCPDDTAFKQFAEQI